ncbi:MAG: histidine phosphatase family protein, partial [Pseudomonadota bacterium]|nr:histidine phosphatase family protein [Pseudomonadota bacterium]
MIRLALIRHAPTDYNAQGRMQGTRDVPLSTQGRAVAAGWRVPSDLAEFAWMSSPLARCCETARLMGLTRAAGEPRLVEMDWGQW